MPDPAHAAKLDFVVTRRDRLTVFSPPNARASVLMVPCATSGALIERVLSLGENQHHAWGVKELIQSNIEVSVADTAVMLGGRLGRDWAAGTFKGYDAIYCNHNQLVRSPIERCLGRHSAALVSLVYSGELLPFARMHSGILGMTPHAVGRFAGRVSADVRLAPWGIDPESALHLPVDPEGCHFVSTGVTHRDFDTMFNAIASTELRAVVAARGRSMPSPSNVAVFEQVMSPWSIRDLYRGAIAGLVILERDDRNRLAVGWTNILELMAVGVPIIKTRTGPLDALVDIETIGAGVLVDPGDVAGLRTAMRAIANDDRERRAMGRRGAAYVRRHFTMEQFASPLIDMISRAIREPGLIDVKSGSAE